MGLIAKSRSNTLVVAYLGNLDCVGGSSKIEIGGLIWSLL